MLISVIIPTHNRPEMLAEALASVRAQTFTDYEIIVVSNGERGDTRRASRNVATAYGAIYFELANGNVAAARNCGVKHAKADWIAFLDDDDLWLPNKLERQLAEALQTGADLIACDAIQFFPDGREAIFRRRRPEGWAYVKAIHHHLWCALPSTVIVRKRALDALGGFDWRQRCHDDTDMWRRISWHHIIHQMDEVLVRYRSGHPSIVQNGGKSHRYFLLYLVQTYLDTPYHLRHTLPPAAMLISALFEPFVPNWILAPLHRLKPRTRLLALRRRLQI